MCALKHIGIFDSHVINLVSLHIVLCNGEKLVLALTPMNYNFQLCSSAI